EEEAPEDAPIRRMADTSWFQLSNLRRGTERGLTNRLLLDYRKEGSGWSGRSLVLGAKRCQQKKELSSMGLFRDEQGTSEVSFFSMGSNAAITVEIWMEEHRRIKGLPLRMKVSHSVAIGNVSEL